MAFATHFSSSFYNISSSSQLSLANLLYIQSMCKMRANFMQQVSILCQSEQQKKQKQKFRLYVCITFVCQSDMCSGNIFHKWQCQCIEGKILIIITQNAKLVYNMHEECTYIEGNHCSFYIDIKIPCSIMFIPKPNHICSICCVSFKLMQILTLFQFLLASVNDNYDYYYYKYYNVIE